MEHGAKSQSDQPHNRPAAERAAGSTPAAAFVDDGQAELAQRTAADAITRSPRVNAQWTSIAHVHNSPRMVAQRRQADAIRQSPRVSAQRTVMERLRSSTGAAKTQASLPAAPISVIQRQRNHDYQDNAVIATAPAHVRTAVQNDLDVNNVVYEETLGAGQATMSLSQMPGVKAQLRQLFQHHGHPLGGGILGTQYALGPGIHIVNVWPQNLQTGPPGAAPQPLVRFKVAVIPHGQHLAAATAAGHQHTVNVQNNMTVTGPLGALSNPFVQNHTCPPLPGPVHNAQAHPLMQVDPSELHQTVAAVFRQKASTLIELTPAAEQNLLAEVRNKNLNNSYTTKQRFITANTYTIHNFDPTAVPPLLETFVANVEYAVFHNPTNNFWQISHFEAVHNRANVQQVALATPSLRHAIGRAAEAPPTVSAPVNNQLIRPTALNKDHQVGIRAPAALLVVRVKIDSGDWKAAARDAANDPGGGIHAWTLMWDAWSSATSTVAEQAESPHRIILEGENGQRERTRQSTRNVRVMRQ